jgi:hypothetical protein
MAVAGAQDELTKRLDVDPTGVTALSIDTEVADLSLSTGVDHDIRVAVVLGSRDDARLPACARSELRSRHDGGTLRLSLSQPGRKRCGERWSVQIPAGLAVTGTVAVGSIEARLSGGYGDVDLRAAVGRATLELNGHRLRSVERRGASQSIAVNGDGARVSLRSQVGNVDASVNTRD